MKADSSGPKSYATKTVSDYNFIINVETKFVLETTLTKHL